MIMEKIRKDVIETCLNLKKKDLLTQTGGNVSVRDEETGYIAITPSGIEYHLLKPEDIVIVDENGNIIDGDKRPSIETPMHTSILKKRRDVNAVVHTHSLYATAYSTLHKPLPVLTTELAIGISSEIPVGEYAVPGSKDLAEKMIEVLKDGKAALLASHGAIALGKDLKEGYSLAISIEEAAKINFIASSMGKPVTITKQMENDLKKVLDYYGQKRG